MSAAFFSTVSRFAESIEAFAHTEFPDPFESSGQTRAKDTLLKSVEPEDPFISHSPGRKNKISATICPQITRVLQRGSRGDDVAKLQAFLALRPSFYPEAHITGYFGVITERAVERFQCAGYIACYGTPSSTGYGLVGPRTAALIAHQCANMSRRP